MDIYREIELYRSLLLLAKENGDVEYYNQERIKFNSYNELMGNYKRKRIKMPLKAAFFILIDKQSNCLQV